MNNVDLHLIKGRPAVHPDDDLIVSHIAITVRVDKMNELRERLHKMGTLFRKNVSVPNPNATKGSGISPLDQVGIRFTRVSKPQKLLSLYDHESILNKVCYI